MEVSVSIKTSSIYSDIFIGDEPLAAKFLTATLQMTGRFRCASIFSFFKIKFRLSSINLHRFFIKVSSYEREDLC